MRVVAGSLRGRRLFAGPGRDVRPTSDRARAGLFSWLGARVAGAHVLDLFAGCGALGIEALSRGARAVVFVERAPAALRALRRNLEALALESRAAVVAQDVRRYLSGALDAQGEGFELVLADPPYGQDWIEWLLGPGRIGDRLAPGGVFIAERSARDPQRAPPPGLVLRDARRYGETAFDWYVREPRAGTG